MALRSACSVHRYFAGRWWRASTSSAAPRGNPLYPVDRISLAGPTITQPTFRLRSLLHDATSRAISMKRVSQCSAMGARSYKAFISTSRRLRRSKKLPNSRWFGGGSNRRRNIFGPRRVTLDAPQDGAMVGRHPDYRAEEQHPGVVVHDQLPATDRALIRVPRIHF